MERSCAGVRITIVFQSWTSRSPRVSRGRPRPREKVHIARLESAAPRYTQVQADLQQYVSSTAEKLFPSSLCVAHSVLDLDIVDPIELHLEGSKANRTHRYMLRVVKYDQTIFADTFNTAEPWNFLNISADLSVDPHKKILEALCRTKGSFKLRLKNGELDFADDMGTGHFRLYNRMERPVWTDNELQGMELEAVNCFYDFSSGKDLPEDQTRGRVTAVFLNELLVFERYFDFLNNPTVKDRMQQVGRLDVYFLIRKVHEFKTLYELLVEPAIPVSEKHLQREKNAELARDLREKLYRFRVIYAALYTVARLKPGQTAEAFKTIAECDSIAGFAPEIPGIFLHLFGCKETHKLLSEKVKPLRKTVSARCKQAADLLEDAARLGYLWRYSSVFLALMKDVFFERVVEHAFGKYSGLNLRTLRAPRNPGATFFAGMVGRREVAVTADRLVWVSNASNEAEQKFGYSLHSPADFSINEEFVIAFCPVIRGFSEIKLLVCGRLSQLDDPECFEFSKPDFRFFEKGWHELFGSLVFVLSRESSSSPFKIALLDLAAKPGATSAGSSSLEEMFAGWNASWRSTDQEAEASITEEHIGRLTFKATEKHFFTQYCHKNTFRELAQTIFIHEGHTRCKAPKRKCVFYHVLDYFHSPEDFTRNTSMFSHLDGVLVLTIRRGGSFLLASVSPRKAVQLARCEDSFWKLEGWFEQHRRVVGTVSNRRVILTAVDRSNEVKAAVLRL